MWPFVISSTPEVGQQRRAASSIGGVHGAVVIGALAGGRRAGRVGLRRLSAAFTVLIILVAGYTLTRSLPGLV
jgi:hypothetical protein